MAELVTRTVMVATDNNANMSTLLWVITPILILIGLVLITIGILMQLNIIKKASTPRIQQINQDITSYGAAGKSQGFAGSKFFTQSMSFPTQTLPENKQYLVNFSPLTAYLAGYIGPVNGGTFDPDSYLSLAFGAGIRSFVLPISTYIDNNKTPENGWPLSGDPAIVCRDASGTIISTNGMSIRQFVSSLLSKKSTNSYYGDEPVFLYIQEVPGYIPDSAKDEVNYVKLMRKIAQELSGLDHIRIINLDSFGYLGSLVGGERETELLTTIPVSNYNGKVIIFTNFQTSLFNKPAYVNKGKTLHEYANFIYKPNTVATSGSLSTGNSSKSIALEDISGSQVNWQRASQTAWYIATPQNPLSVPNATVVKNALSQGIQCIPIPFIFNDMKDAGPSYNLWKGSSALVKPVNDPDANLFTKQPPIVPAQPSQAMNARVTPSQQPGQLNVS